MVVILGADENTYGFARFFHENYGICPIAYSTKLLEVCKNTDIVDINIDEKLHDTKHLVSVLTDLAVRLKKEYKKLILIPCSDFYLELLVKKQEDLKDYENVFISYSEFKTFNDKVKFYELCSKYDLPYPKTVVLTSNNYKEKIKEVKFPYPFILKPANSNSIEYLDALIDGKEKVYYINDAEELLEKVETIYNSNYQKELLVQEFIRGRDVNNRVLNVYSDRHGKVRLMSLGEPILEEYHPATFGNYAAIISSTEKPLIMDKIKNFLEAIKFTGAANFDLKIDDVTKEYYIFEINPRPGRSSYYTTCAGVPLGQAYVDDLILGKIDDVSYNEKEILWLNVPMCLVKKYVKDEETLKRLKKIKKQKGVYHTLFYKKDSSLKRKFFCYLQYARKIHYYPKYYIDKK